MGSGNPQGHPPAPPTPRPGPARPFDVYGPLPTGLTLLEASAGTGKTFAIATLAARYLAEGTPVEELLVVTFTRAATGELRDRVRERLVLAERGLRRLLDHWPPDLERKQGGQDELVSVLARGPREEVAARVDRLATALADFDAGTITTTHGFCQHILWGLGTAGDVGRGVQFLEDCSDLVEQVVGDLYVRKFAGRREPSLTLASALEIGRAAVDNPDAVIEPRSAPDDPGAAMRVRLAGAVRREVVRRKLRTGTLGYDDLLTRLAETLRSDRGPQACERLRERYKVVLVDEFQDTDPLQWEILQRSFGQPGTTLVLIGDPKQAIYSFRGADVWAYLEAAGAATDRATLGINWRADQGLVEATDALLGGAALGHPDIRCHPVQAAPVHR
ncbi:MAG: UvrD-helicase domain-containing protein, partial [Acidimicrobiales bacterium]